jgi:arsenate reductase
LFICTHNAARSQIAEGLVNRFLDDRYVASSAGTRPSRVHPNAVEVMAEVGIDISHQRSKHLDDFNGLEFDYVVTLCSDAEDLCPFFPGKEHLHQGFHDPAAAKGSEDEMLNAFRLVRDEIRAWIMATFNGQIVVDLAEGYHGEEDRQGYKGQGEVPYR